MVQGKGQDGVPTHRASSEWYPEWGVCWASVEQHGLSCVLETSGNNFSYSNNWPRCRMLRKRTYLLSICSAPYTKKVTWCSEQTKPNSLCPHEASCHALMGKPRAHGGKVTKQPGLCRSTYYTVLLRKRRKGCPELNSVPSNPQSSYLPDTSECMQS